jgi:hypothetical protein
MTAVLFDGDEVTGTTILSRRSAAGAFETTIETERKADRALVIGFREDQITSLQGFVDGDAVVEIAANDEPILPAPSFRAAMSLDPAGRLEPTNEDIRLTIPWLVGCRAILASDPGVVDASCFSIPCDIRARQAGCDVEIDVLACNGGALRGRVDANGVGTYDVSPTFGACVHRRREPPSELSMSCEGGTFASEGCLLDVYRRREPAFAVERMSFGGAPITPMTPFEPRWIGGLAVLEDTVVVARSATPAEDGCASIASTFAFIDLETLAVASTLDAPDCSIHLVDDGSGGFVAVHRSPVWSVSRFDREGAMVDTSSIPAGAAARIRDLARNGSDLALIVQTGTAANQALLMKMDPLRFDRLLDLGAPDHRAAAAYPPNGFVFADNDKERLTTVRGPIVDHLGIRSGCGMTGVWDVLSHGPTSSFVMTSRGESSRAILILGDRGDTDCQRRVFYEGSREPLALAAWPADPDLVFVTLDGDERALEDDTYVALFDVPNVRFLPGALRVGVGPAIHAAPDARGRVWVTLDYSDEVVRVEAR